MDATLLCAAIAAKRNELLDIFQQVKESDLITGEDYERLTNIHLGVHDDQTTKLQAMFEAGNIDYSHAIERLNGLADGIQGVMWEFALNMSKAETCVNPDPLISALYEKYDGTIPSDHDLSARYFDNNRIGCVRCM